MTAVPTFKKTSAKNLQDGFDYFNSTKSKMPRSAFLSLKEAVLGKKYDLSVAVVDTRKIHELNLRWRDKDAPTDILSFPLSETEGEIYINPAQARKKAKEFGRSYDNFILFLFIHGLVHLKGCDHGVIMESIEVKFRRRFGI